MDSPLFVLLVRRKHQQRRKRIVPGVPKFHDGKFILIYGFTTVCVVGEKKTPTTV